MVEKYWKLSGLGVSPQVDVKWLRTIISPISRVVSWFEMAE